MMKQALNATDIKRQNQRLILDAVFRSGSTSRSQLSKELSLSKPAISDNLTELLEAGIVRESGESSPSPSGGRKSILLQPNGNHRYILAINLNFSHPFFALGNLTGDILQSMDFSVPPGSSTENSVELLRGQVRTMLDALGQEREKVYCIAVAAPGTFDEQGNLSSYNPDCNGPMWWQVDVRSLLQQEFGLPVLMYNDVKAATLGEWTKGEVCNVQNLFYLSVGLGIGSGIILNNALLMGEQFDAGEIYDYIDPAAAMAGFNLESTICLNYLKDSCFRARHPAFPVRQEIHLKDIVRVYQGGDPVVVEIVDRICSRLAVVSFNCMNLLSARNMVFGGEYTPFGDCFIRHLQRLYLHARRPVPRVMISRLGKMAGIYGVLYLAKEKYFQEFCNR